jgi:hypothetical protein
MIQSHFWKNMYYFDGIRCSIMGRAAWRNYYYVWSLAHIRVYNLIDLLFCSYFFVVSWVVMIIYVGGVPVRRAYLERFTGVRLIVVGPLYWIVVEVDASSGKKWTDCRQVANILLDCLLNRQFFFTCFECGLYWLIDHLL